MTISDSLRTIAARLVLRESSLIDGRMVLAYAEAVAALESELATIHEQADEIVMALNDPLEAMRRLVTTLQKRPAKPVDPMPLDAELAQPIDLRSGAFPTTREYPTR